MCFLPRKHNFILHWKCISGCQRGPFLLPSIAGDPARSTAKVAAVHWRHEGQALSCGLRVHQRECYKHQHASACTSMHQHAPARISTHQHASACISVSIESRACFLGWPEPYVHIVHGRIFGCFPAKNYVCTLYIIGSGQPYTFRFWTSEWQQALCSCKPLLLFVLVSLYSFTLTWREV